MRTNGEAPLRGTAATETMATDTTARAAVQPDPIGVALLGATGVVGERIARLLRGHPFLRLDEVMASERSAGCVYGDVVGLADVDMAYGLRLKAPGDHLDSPIILSALPGHAAAELELDYARRGHLVCSNAAAFRSAPLVPLLVPEVNPHALALLDAQVWPGGLVTNPNCVVSGLTLALAPLLSRYGIEGVTLVTLQALSGAGRRGLHSWETTANVIPHIGGETEKISDEIHKVLDADFPVSVQVNRVPVIDGHTVSVFVRLRERAPLDAIKTTLAEFTAAANVAALPSAPGRPLQLFDAPDRPQPRIDLHAGNGMTVSVGSFAAGPIYDASFTLLVHNLVRGAAGACVLNAEFAVASGRVTREPQRSVGTRRFSSVNQLATTCSHSTLGVSPAGGAGNMTKRPSGATS